MTIITYIILCLHVIFHCVFSAIIFKSNQIYFIAVFNLFSALSSVVSAPAPR